MYMYMYTLHKYTCIYMHVYMYLYMYIHYLSLLFQVPGKFELKGHDRVQGLSSLNVERQNQFLPGQRRDVTYVSRLQVYTCAWPVHPWKIDCLGCAVLLCLVVYLTLLAPFFLPSSSLINM